MGPQFKKEVADIAAVVWALRVTTRVPSRAATFDSKCASPATGFCFSATRPLFQQIVVNLA